MRTVQRICLACHKKYACEYRLRNSKKFCSRTCFSLYRSNTPENFFAQIDMSGGPNACWPFEGTRTKKGYGEIHFHGEKWLAHRLAFLLHYQHIDDDLLVCHTCDNPPCCNYSHLFQGTNKENIEDATKKGHMQKLSLRRLYTPIRYCPQCGTAFSTHLDKNKKYCSPECYSLVRVLIRPDMLLRGQYTLINFCDICSRAFPYKPSQKKRFCSRDCYYQSIASATPRLDRVKLPRVDFGRHHAKSLPI